MSHDDSSLTLSEAIHITFSLRRAIQRRHQVPPPEHYPLHIGRMLRLCFIQPGMEERHKKRAVLMCVLLDLDQVMDLDPRVTDERRGDFENNTISYIRDRLEYTNSDLASMLSDVWREYVLNNTDLSKLVREMRNLIRLHQVVVDERSLVKIHPEELIVQLRVSILDEWLQQIANCFLEDWIVHREIQSTGPVIFVVGGPGSGKTAVCSRLASKYDCDHVSLQSLLDEEADNPNSFFGPLIVRLRNQGRHIPVSVSIGVLKERIRTTATGRGVLVDGFPENIAQVEEYEQQVSPRYSTVYLNCPVQTMVERLTRRWNEHHLPGDAQPVTQTRITNFVTTRTMILNHLRNNRFEPVSAGGNEQMVLEEVEKVVA